MLVRVAAGSAVVALVAGCSAPPRIEESGSRSSSVEQATGGDGCDPAASKKRLDATFDRTFDCATDAASAGFASKVKLAGEAVKDTKRIVDSIKSLAASVGANVKDVSTARAILCVRAVTDYGTEESGKAAIKAAAAALGEIEASKLAEAAAGSFSFGVSDTFKALADVSADPSGANLVAFLGSFASNISVIGNMAQSCGSVLAPFGTVAIPSLAKYAEAFANVGVISSIGKCSYALVGNTIDVGSELICYGKDLETIRKQEATLTRAHAGRCESFQSMVGDPTLLPLLQSGATSDDRRSACYNVTLHWGSCLYNAKRSGLFGQTKLSCDECTSVCNGYVNGAGPNAYLQPVLDGASAASGANATDVQRLVHQAAMSCGPDVQPDGLLPCVHFCRGQVADCP